MDQFLAYAIVGLTTAAIYAVVGSGLVLTYTTTGVFNFAHGAAGMLAAFTYWQLTVGWGWPVPVALAAVLLVIAPVFGALMERVIIRPVAGLGEAERLVVTVAMLSAFIAIGEWIWNPNNIRTLPAFFPNSAPIKVGPVSLTYQQLITMGVAILVAIVLRIVLHQTRLGTQMRATVDDRALAGLTGANANQANRFAWIFSSQLAAIGGILIAPQLTLDQTQLALLIVSAYTAAVFGRLRSLPMTFVGAVVVGLAQSFLTGYLPQKQDLQGLEGAAPALLLFLALLVFPHGRLRGKSVRLVPVRVPSLRGLGLLALVTVVFGVVLATVLSSSDLVTYGTIFSLGLVALSFVPLGGYAGQFSLCQLTIAAIGALTWAHLGQNGQWWALLVAVAVSGVAGGVIAVPALRLSGIYLILGTAAFAVVCDLWIFQIPQITIGGLHITLFGNGTITAVGPRVFGHDFDSQKSLLIIAAVFLALVSFGVGLLRRGRFGRRLIALRDSEAAYAMLGGNLLLARVAVFALSAAIAGLGGALYAMQEQSLVAGQFSFEAGLPYFLIAVVAGLSSVGAGLFTGTLLIGPFNALTQVAPGLTNFTALLPGLAGIGLGRNPAGLIPMMRAQWAPVARRLYLIVGLVVLFVALWVLRLRGDINGWVLFWVPLIAALAVQLYGQAAAGDPQSAPVVPAGGAHRKRAEPEEPAKPVPAAPVAVPVEWWGLSRPWQAEDEEVLDNVISRG
jgi:branched-chain amino acid transport system permease protein